MYIKEKLFHSHDISLSYYVIGEGKTLLFLPGGLRVSTYKRTIAALAHSYKVIAIDLPGFGKSSTPKEIWGLEEYAQFLSSFITHLGISTLPVVGHSYGGGVGLYLAMQNKHVSKLMVFSPMGVESKHSRFGFYYTVLVTKSINDFLALKSNRMRALVFNNAISTVTENPKNIKKMIQVTNKVLYKHTTPDELQKITVPVQLMWARHDELFPLQNGYYLKEYIPNSTLEILEGNHDWITINPDNAVEKIRNFIK
jgi:pimeloyl-ACP methyl ester carboxylesterase